jgi:hypothetical protein
MTIDQKYQTLGGASGFLGVPQVLEPPISNGQPRVFFMADFPILIKPRSAAIKKGGPPKKGPGRGHCFPRPWNQKSVQAVCEYF